MENEMLNWTTVIVAIVSILGTGGIYTLITQFANRRKISAEAVQIDAQIKWGHAAEWQKLYNEMRSEVDRLRTYNDDLRAFIVERGLVPPKEQRKEG